MSSNAAASAGEVRSFKPGHSPSDSLSQGGEAAAWMNSPPSQPPHCSFCLVAEFDIDKGSTLSYQYPGPIGHDDHMLAELMLPDGVHARSEDWTVFFLPAEADDPTGHQVQGQGQDRGEERAETTSSKGEEKGRENLYYVLNLVRTKHDTSVRRGALVKAIAVGTRHPFIQIFKPALLLALDDYFKSPSIEVLMRLFESLNSLDLSAMPQFSRDEKLILRASDRRDLFEERFKDNPQPRSASGLRHISNMNIDDDDRFRNESARSRSGSTSTTQSSLADEGVSKQATNSGPVGTGAGRSTPHLHNRPSLASLRPGSGGSGLLKRRPSAAAQLQMQQSSTGFDGSHISLPTNATWRRPSGAAVSSMATLGNGKVKDTHYWETSVTYGKIQDLPIRIPTDVFAEEVGEYSLIDLINTFSSSTPVGPLHPHLHSNGHLTPPIIILFNAIVTGKRIVFLGHNQPASKVVSHVLSACALGSGCGTGWRGIAKRCFPYANLGTMDELEKVAGYVAGVTNPRFEDLHAWDVLFNIESGKITIAKDIEPAPPIRLNSRPAMTEAVSSGSIGSSTGYGPEGEAKMTRTPSEPDVVSASVASFGMGGGTVRGRDRSGTVLEAKVDAAENIFMEEVLLAVAARYGEKHIRARFSDYAANFIRQVNRHEEHFYGHTSIGVQSQPYLNGQLGSGLVALDREVEVREVQANAMRVEAFRGIESYKLYRNDEAGRERTRSISGFDLPHQLGRLRRGRKLQTSECELIFTSIARATRTSEQMIELLALLPAHQGGLFPLSCGMFHPSSTIRAATQDLFVRLASHPAGKKVVQGLNMFHRLALARLIHESHEAKEMMASTNQAANSSFASQHSSSMGASSHFTPALGSREGLASLSTQTTSTLTPPTAREGLPNTESSVPSFPPPFRATSPAAYT